MLNKLNENKEIITISTSRSNKMNIIQKCEVKPTILKKLNS